MLEEKILLLLEKQGEHLERLDGRLDAIDSRLDAIDSRLDAIDDRLDAIDGRLDAIDGRLDALESKVDPMEKQIRNINVTLENMVFPQLQALAEGQQTILETLSPKNRVEALEDEVMFLKQVIKSISHDVNELRKAQ